MKEIVIVSGKGGTGKTSIAASLAILAGNEAVIADCDVDAANMHLLMNPDFSSVTDFYSGELAIVDDKKCTLCGNCASVCRFAAVTLTDTSAVITAMDCEGCGYCQRICPSRAIEMIPRKTGKLYISNIRTGSSMVHATMEVGAENSGKLVSRVRDVARSIAAKQNIPYVIIDGSPGIGCPVIASLAGADLTVLVTEPSASALHDMIRVNEVIERFRIKTVCIINKNDVNLSKCDEIKLFLDNKEIKHIADLPYDKEVASAMAEGKTITENASEKNLAIHEIWNQIKNLT